MSQQWKTPPEMQIDTTRSYTCAIETDRGTIGIKLFASEAPKTVNNFVFLVHPDQHGFFSYLSYPFF